MSFLLDAVGREKQAQGQLDVTAHSPVAPKPRSVLSLYGHFSWPIVTAAIAAAGAYAWQTRPLPEQPPVVAAIADVTVTGTVEMPMPVAFIAPKPEPKPMPKAAEPEPKEYVYYPESTTPVREASAKPQAQPAQKVAQAKPKVETETRIDEQKLADNALLAAFRAAVQDTDYQQQAQPQRQPQQQSKPEPAEMTPQELMNLNLADYNSGDYRSPEPEPMSAEAQAQAMEMSAEQLLAQATANSVTDQGQAQPAAQSAPDLFAGIAPELSEMPLEFRKSMPDINITAHVYSSENDSRWLRANGREAQEGDLIAPGVKVKEIQPNAVVLEKEGQAFTVPPLGKL